jgi:hypothetical protein
VRLGFPDDGLDCRKKEIRKLTTDIVAELLSEAGLPPVIPFAQQLLDLKGEKADARQYVYLVTISRVLVAILADGRGYKDLQEMSRKEIADALRDSLSNSMQDSAGRGRPRNAEAEPLVLSVFVFRECHADGSFHFHATRGSRGHSRVTPDRRSRTSAAHTHTEPRRLLPTRCSMGARQEQKRPQGWRGPPVHLRAATRCQSCPSWIPVGYQLDTSWIPV